MSRPRPLLSREEALQVARSWLGTPYVLGGRVRQAGCDCATLLAEYAIACGFADREDLGLYSQDWFCNASEERYLYGLIRHAPQAAKNMGCAAEHALPGCLVLFKVVGSRLYNHGGIVTVWPHMIHASSCGVMETNALQNPMTAGREKCIFDPWERAA